MTSLQDGPPNPSRQEHKNWCLVLLKKQVPLFAQPSGQVVTATKKYIDRCVKCNNFQYIDTDLLTLACCITDRGWNKVGLQANCSQKLVRANKMLRPRAYMALKKVGSFQYLMYKGYLKKKKKPKSGPDKFKDPQFFNTINDPWNFLLHYSCI